MNNNTLTHPTQCIDDAPAYPVQDGENWYFVTLDGSRAYFTDYAPALAYAHEVLTAYVAAHTLRVDRSILTTMADDLRRVNHRIPSREVGRVLAVLTVLLSKEVAV